MSAYFLLQKKRIERLSKSEKGSRSNGIHRIYSIMPNFDTRCCHILKIILHHFPKREINERAEKLNKKTYLDLNHSCQLK